MLFLAEHDTGSEFKSFFPLPASPIRFGVPKAFSFCSKVLVSFSKGSTSKITAVQVASFGTLETQNLSLFDNKSKEVEDVCGISVFKPFSEIFEVVSEHFSSSRNAYETERSRLFLSLRHSIMIVND